MNFNKTTTLIIIFIMALGLWMSWKKNKDLTERCDCTGSDTGTGATEGGKRVVYSRML